MTHIQIFIVITNIFQSIDLMIENHMMLLLRFFAAVNDLPSTNHATPPKSTRSLDIESEKRCSPQKQKLLPGAKTRLRSIPLTPTILAAIVVEFIMASKHVDANGNEHESGYVIAFHL